MKQEFSKLSSNMIIKKGAAQPTRENGKEETENQNQSRISITLKLKEKPYLRMKTYGAQNRMTNQEILEIALEDFLDKQSA